MSCSGEPSPGEGLKSFQGVVHFASVHYKQTRSALSVILVSRVSHALGKKGFLASLPSLPRRFVRVFRSNTARVACVYARFKKNTTVLQSSSERETVFLSSQRKFWPISWKDLNSSGTASV